MPYCTLLFVHQLVFGSQMHCQPPQDLAYVVPAACYSLPLQSPVVDICYFSCPKSFFILLVKIKTNQKTVFYFHHLIGMVVTWHPSHIPRVSRAGKSKYHIHGIQWLWSRQNPAESFFCNCYRCSPSVILGTEHLYVGKKKIYEVNMEKSKTKRWRERKELWWQCLNP